MHAHIFVLKRFKTFTCTCTLNTYMYKWHESKLAAIGSMVIEIKHVPILYIHFVPCSSEGLPAPGQCRTNGAATPSEDWSTCTVDPQLPWKHMTYQLVSK